MTRWAIMGWYWPILSGDERYYPVDHNKTRTFSGDIEIDENGTFKGETNDHFGYADIVGSIDKRKIEFYKEYRDSAIRRGSANGKITYLLQVARIQIKNEKIATGWKGVCHGKNAHGNAACMLHPLLS